MAFFGIGQYMIVFLGHLNIFLSFPCCAKAFDTIEHDAILQFINIKASMISGQIGQGKFFLLVPFPFCSMALWGNSLNVNV
jgi:hypothetical protein